MASDALIQVATAQFVLLTTFRRDGRAVASPVYVVPFACGAGVWTVAGSAKVRRLRADPRVTVVPCDARGGVADGAEVVAGRVRILDADGTAAVRTALCAKYGMTEEQLHETLVRSASTTPARDVGLAIEP